MEIEIVEKHDNILLERTEVKAKAQHPKESTPARKVISEALKEVLGLKKEVLVVDSVDSSFGKNESSIFAKIYKNVESARKVEARHILKRNGLWQEPKKKE
jgi:small subunit ribosomal protein S24e